MDSRLTSLSSNHPKQLLHPRLVQIIVVVLLLLATFALNFRMIRDGINGMTDMRWHILWLQHFSQQLREGIWYPRWLAGTNYGYGSPTFVFYPPLVYYLGSLIKFTGLNIENTLITLYSLSLFLAGFNFYLFGRRRWGVFAAVLGALTYMSAPYLAYNLYWVASLSVAYAIALIPLGWWLTDLSLARPKWKIAVAIFWAVFALTHLPNLLLCGLVWLVYTLFFLFSHSWKNVLSTIVSAGVGLGLAAFFLVPAVLEQPLVNIASMQNVIGDITNGIFGAGVPFIPRKLDFQVSHIFAHQTGVIIILSAIAIFLALQDQKTAKQARTWIFFCLALALMMSPLSIPIWRSSATLQKVQAPWRIFSLYAFGSAALCGIVAAKITRIKLPLKVIIAAIIAAILLLNASYGYQVSRKFPTFRNPGQANLDHLRPARLALDEPFTNRLIDVEEYRPIVGTDTPSPDPILGQPRLSLIDGQADIEINQWQSYRRDFNIVAQTPSTIRVRTYNYPAWHLYINDQSYPIKSLEDGTISFTLTPGSYKIELLYQKTPAFIIGIVVSLLSLLVLLIYGIMLAKKSSLRQQLSDYSRSLR